MKPDKGVSDLKFFLKNYLGRIVAGWKGFDKDNYVVGDYEYVSSKEKGIEKLKEYGYKEGESDLLTNL